MGSWGVIKVGNIRPEEEGRYLLGKSFEASPQLLGRANFSKSARTMTSLRDVPPRNYDGYRGWRGNTLLLEKKRYLPVFEKDDNLTLAEEC